MKRKFTLISLLSTGIIFGYLNVIGWLLGFIIAKCLGGHREGELGRLKSIVIPIRRYELHLHHWLICLIASAFGAIKGFYLVSPEIFYGFLGGLTFQGIYCYKDWYKILKLKGYLKEHPGT